jgi:hypothetical protein
MGKETIARNGKWKKRGLLLKIQSTSDFLPEHPVFYSLTPGRRLIDIRYHYRFIDSNTACRLVDNV